MEFGWVRYGAMDAESGFQQWPGAKVNSRCHTKGNGHDTTAHASNDFNFSMRDTTSQYFVWRYILGQVETQKWLGGRGRELETDRGKR